MKMGMKRGLAFALCACLSIGAITGCSKKSERNNSAAMLTLKDGGSVSVGAANVYLRYQQAEFENGFGQFLKNYYQGVNIWDADFSGTGEAYGNTFKEQILTDLQHMLLAKAHADDFNITVSDDETNAIAQAAESFIAENDAEMLEKIGATQESVEEMLTLYTLKTKMETAMGADVDTEVSDEEAAQTTISAIYFNASVDEPEEEETEGLLEEMSEGISEAAGDVQEALTEAAEAAAELESEVKTQSADEAETLAEEEAVTEAAQEAATEDVGEGAAEESTEAETETESPEMMAARAMASARAEAFLAEVQAGMDFDTLASEAQADETQKAYSNTYTFGDSDTYPADEIREAVKGLEDGEVVDHVIMVGTSYYVVKVTDAFDEAATEREKESIVEQRRSDAVNALYEEWTEASGFELDSNAWTSLIFDVALNYPQEAETEGLSEAAGEAATEGEAVAESPTES